MRSLSLKPPHSSGLRGRVNARTQLSALRVGLHIRSALDPEPMPRRRVRDGTAVDPHCPASPPIYLLTASYQPHPPPK